MIKTVTFLIFTLGAVSASYADNRQIEKEYLSSNISAYEAAIERCDDVASSQPMPDRAVLQDLQDYDTEKVRTFLITRSALLSEECTKPELTELAYAIGLLEVAENNGEVATIIESTKPFLFGKETWELKKLYLSLPDSLRTSLERHPYFQTPYDDVAVVHALEESR